MKSWARTRCPSTCSCSSIAKRDRVKLLVWERDGFWLLYKRLEAGTFATLERDKINARELYLLLEGIEVVGERRRYIRLSANV
jgi:transposase